MCLLNRCGEHTYIYIYCILIHTVDIVLCWLVGEMDLQQSGVSFPPGYKNFRMVPQSLIVTQNHQSIHVPKLVWLAKFTFQKSAIP